MRMTRKLTTLGVAALVPMAFTAALGVVHAQSPDPGQAPEAQQIEKIAPPAATSDMPSNVQDAIPQPLAPKAAATETAAPDTTQTTANDDAQPADIKNDAAVATKTDLVGLKVVSSDGSNVGEVTHVKAGDDGRVEAIHVQTGGFLGIGSKTVIVPAGQFVETKEMIKLSMAADDLDKLPRVTPQG